MGTLSCFTNYCRRGIYLDSYFGFDQCDQHIAVAYLALADLDQVEAVGDGVSAVGLVPDGRAVEHLKMNPPLYGLKKYTRNYNKYATDCLANDFVLSRMVNGVVFDLLCAAEHLGDNVRLCFKKIICHIKDKCSKNDEAGS